MNNKEFCYWLQGYFELGGLKELTNKQLEIIQAHLNLVRKVDGRLDEFTGWLEGTLETWQHFKSDLPAEIADKIITRLANKFQHDIDPSYSGDQDDLNNIHLPPGFKPDKDVMIRC